MQPFPHRTHALIITLPPPHSTSYYCPPSQPVNFQAFFCFHLEWADTHTERQEKAISAEKVSEGGLTSKAGWVGVATQRMIGWWETRFARCYRCTRLASCTLWAWVDGVVWEGCLCVCAGGEMRRGRGGTEWTGLLSDSCFCLPDTGSIWPVRGYLSSAAAGACSSSVSFQLSCTNCQDPGLLMFLSWADPGCRSSRSRLHM
jgi:hypothetical protein